MAGGDVYLYIAFEGTTEPLWFAHREAYIYPNGPNWCILQGLEQVERVPINEAYTALFAAQDYECLPQDNIMIHKPW